MKRKYFLKLLLFSTLISLFVFGCEKDKSGEVATLSTTVISKITPLSAIVSAVVISDGGTALVRGFCWRTDQGSDTTVTDSMGVGDYSYLISGLTPGITYYVKAYAVNVAGTSYGEEVSFRTTPLPSFNPNLSYGTVTDIDGNVYKTIQIGTQIWMAENLKTSHYRNGDPIPEVTGKPDWLALTTGAYSNYNNNADFAVVYGKYYNGYAVEDSRNIAPAGWHVPSYNEWKTLSTYLSNSALLLYEAGYDHWNSKPYQTFINQYGFTAIPGGLRDAGTFANMGASIDFWTSTPLGTTFLNYVNFRSDFYFSTLPTGCGMNIRCVKD